MNHMNKVGYCDLILFVRSEKETINYFKAEATLFLISVPRIMNHVLLSDLYTIQCVSLDCA